MSKVEDIIHDLKRRKASVACEGKNGLRMYLQDLGFIDIPGKTDGHRIFTHPKLSEHSNFISFSIDCGHRPRREMKTPYVVKTVKVLQSYQDLLEKLEGEGYA
ncbi:TPA: hypothetical protein L9K80_000405 [Klebsiella quasipneumoniae subsp. similipneumoniae]|nr:MAG TPA: Thrombin light chain [Caudoviricetes sp.]HBQ6716699.1 hypothetical protein [Klebsiella quasipneumoniae subsp. similipneumoniae]HBR1026799.1 hypothetical protein [Klebsiella quasipneumoniae subsp. similipneumoniae]